MGKHRPHKEVELYRDEDRYTVYVDLPGYEADDITVRFHEGRLHVGAEHVDKATGRTRVYHRELGFPKAIDADGMEASYEDGVLEIYLPIRGGERRRGTAVQVT